MAESPTSVFSWFTPAQKLAILGLFSAMVKVVITQNEHDEYAIKQKAYSYFVLHITVCFDLYTFQLEEN